MIHKLNDTIEREGAQIGLFVILDEPSPEMQREPTTAGRASLIDGCESPRTQILTIRELLEEHKNPMFPLLILTTYQHESVSEKKAIEQQEMFG